MNKHRDKIIQFDGQKKQKGGEIKTDQKIENEKDRSLKMEKSEVINEEDKQVRISNNVSEQCQQVRNQQPSFGQSILPDINIMQTQVADQSEEIVRNLHGWLELQNSSESWVQIQQKNHEEFWNLPNQYQYQVWTRLKSQNPRGNQIDQPQQDYDYLSNHHQSPKNRSFTIQEPQEHMKKIHFKMEEDKENDYFHIDYVMIEGELCQIVQRRY